MIITQRETIYWGEIGGTYMYGSNVSYYPDKSVRLYNPPSSPSGEVLKTWFLVLITKVLGPSHNFLYSKEIINII